MFIDVEKLNKGCSMEVTESRQSCMPCRVHYGKTALENIIVNFFKWEKIFTQVIDKTCR